MAAQLFVKSQKIQKAVALINDLDGSKFPLLLLRILQKIHLKEEIFTKEEEGKLMVALSVDPQQLELILETLTFFFEQATYYLAKPAVLTQQLQALGLNEEKVSGIVQAWISNARNIADKLKKRTVASKQLVDVNWQLRLQLAQASLQKMKCPMAVIELILNSNDGDEKLQMEFTHDKLYALYNQLEVIQSQLDALRK